jgi:hypothetical protein
MPSAVPLPDGSEEVHLGIFAETVRAVLGRAEGPWPRPHPHPYPDPDEVVIPPPRPSSEPVPPPPPPEERTADLPTRDLPAIDIGQSGTDDPTEPALAMLSRGRHGL